MRKKERRSGINPTKIMMKSQAMLLMRVGRTEQSERKQGWVGSGRFWGNREMEKRN